MYIGADLAYMVIKIFELPLQVQILLHPPNNYITSGNELNLPVCPSPHLYNMNNNRWHLPLRVHLRFNDLVLACHLVGTH